MRGICRERRKQREEETARGGNSERRKQREEETARGGNSERRKQREEETARGGNSEREVEAATGGNTRHTGSVWFLRRIIVHKEEQFSTQLGSYSSCLISCVPTGG
jgi:hypothetical protein